MKKMNPLLLIGTVVALFLIYLGVQFFMLWLKVKVSRELVAHAQAYTQHPRQPTLRILVVGDSTAVGVGARSEDSIAGRIGKMYPSADVENISLSGMKTGWVEERLKELSAAARYDVILLQVGANDVVGLTNTEELRAQIHGALTEASLHAPHVLVMSSGDVGLAPLFSFPLTQLFSYRTRVVRGIFIQESAKADTVAYVDLYKEGKDEPFSTNIPLYYAPDLFHPSGEGHGLWFQQLKVPLEAALSSKK